MPLVDFIASTLTNSRDYLLGNPLPNGYGSSTTAAQVACDFKEHLHDKVAIVTGCNVGIGKETVRALSQQGTTVIMACRDMTKCKEAIQDIQSSDDQSSQASNLIPLECDLSSFQSIRSFVDSFHQLHLPLHVLINNAGVMMCPYTSTTDGHELQFGTNHLGHFLLTELLLNDLKQSAPSRVVIVASQAHHMSYPGGILFDQLTDCTRYNRVQAYAQSKLANIIHAKELNQRLAHHNITVNALHPGVIASDLQRHLSIAGSIANVCGRPFNKSQEQGAATSVYLAAAPQVQGHGGDYYMDCNVAHSTIKEVHDTSIWTQLRTVSQASCTDPKDIPAK